MAGFTFIIVTGVLASLISARRHPRDALVALVPPPPVACDKGEVEPLEWCMAAREEQRCPGDQWRCLDGEQCIPYSAVCSGGAECEDGSDESPRFCGCEKDQFRCGELCLPCIQRCDNVKQCPAGEDEHDCLSHTCPAGYFQCVRDGVCVPLAAVCNYTIECADKSDEEQCDSDASQSGYRECYASEFRCDSGQCVWPYAVCDGEPQCGDSSDEKECAPSDFVTCKSGRRIHKFWHCNHYPDCSEKYHFDDTDELGCTCSEDHFVCSNGRCIYKGNKCDAKCDCEDCGDEVACEHVYTKESGVVECLKGRSVQCNDRCIAREYICDGIHHCQGKDFTEEGCYDHENKTCIFTETTKQEKIYFFQCADLKCLPTLYLCDGVRHCLDGDDEDHCGLNGACRDEGFRCLDGSCIAWTLQCDGKEDCPHGLDEENCGDPLICDGDEWPCERFSQCIPAAWRCNHRYDCRDGSDERFCSNHTCGEDQWRCSSGHCVAKSVRCNAIPDCKDWSDEKYCEEHECRPGEVKCKAGQCVDKEGWCNITKECLDGSDEENCEPPPQCESDEWQCTNGQCKPFEDRCTVYPDDRQSCLDLSHLLNCSSFVCPAGMFKCYQGPCMDMRMKCDSKLHCPDSWVDEQDCPFICSASNRDCKCLDQEIDCTFQNLTTFPGVERNINRYQFAHNRIGESLHQQDVEGHGKVIFLNLCNNHITELGDGTLSGLQTLITLLLCNNNITNITYGNFKGLKKLQGLDLTGNQITRLGPKGFYGLRILHKLDLSRQRIHEIAPDAFFGLKNLHVLVLSYNYLTAITTPVVFDGLTQLRILRLSYNLLTTISDSDTFARLPLLQTLAIDHNPLEHVGDRVLQALPNLNELSTPEFRFCCLPHHANVCLPRTEEFSSCEDLMSNLVLRVFVWVVGFVALVGNTSVIVWRLLYPSGSKKNHSMLFVNLALGDLLMGGYLLVIAGVDLYYRGVYRLHERQWRSSYLCQLAGFLSTFSSEASVFTLTVITLDRLTIILSPFGVRRVHGGLTKRLMVVVWCVAFLLAALPILFPLLIPLPYFDDYYGRSGVCLALHITDEKPNGWEYSVFIFLVLNLLSFSVIAVSYILIYTNARETPLMESGKNKHGKDREMGRRVSYIVGTDAACWLPIIMLGIASLSGVHIPRKVFAWVAVFVLPLNAALNPLLYTFFTKPVRKRLQDMRESITSWHTRSTRSSFMSGVRMTSTYRGKMSSEVTDIPVIPLNTSDAKVHFKAAICVYTPANSTTTTTQVTHFIHEPTHQAGTQRTEVALDQNGTDTKQVLD